ncbi:MAG: hypothetical protein M3Y72_22175 [Acidobacteriota bacterium]|nr:hypothetical protein [Acidobacteriota bacterium]
MPIIYYPTLFRQSQVFKAGLLQLSQLHRIPAGLSVYPHTLPIFNLGAREILANADPGSTAKQVGWRYFAGVDNPKTTVAGDVDMSSVPQIASLFYGASAWTALQAAEALGDLPDLSGDSYEPRMLRIPGLLIEALWLKPLSAGAGTDRIVPYHTLIKSLDPATPYPAQDFFDKIRHFAEQAITDNGSHKTARQRPTLK